jgi:hypothetical protein
MARIKLTHFFRAKVFLVAFWFFQHTGCNILKNLEFLEKIFCNKFSFWFLLHFSKLEHFLFFILFKFICLIN